MWDRITAFLTEWRWVASITLGAFMVCVMHRHWRAILSKLEMWAEGYADRHMPPTDSRRFDRRIKRRVRWLRFKDAVSRWRPLGWVARHMHRPLAVLALFALTLWVFSLAGIPLQKVPDRLSDLANSDDANLRWQEALILVGAPIAFMLWWFRDIHVSETLANQRKDVNLKEFQEIQARAAGALDTKLSDRAREVLQIAAIHQLRPFLKGEFGKDFQRPAFELIRARLVIAAEEQGFRGSQNAVREWMDRWQDLRLEGEESVASLEQMKEQLRAFSAARRITPVTAALHMLASEEWRTIFALADPITKLTLDGIALPSHALLAGRDLGRHSMICARLRETRLDGANLSGARLDGANLLGARLDGIDLTAARLNGADLAAARLDGADLSWAQLAGANLTSARLNGAMLWEARLSGACLWHARLDDANLVGARLEGASLWQARLDAADLSDASAWALGNCTEMVYNDATRFAENWEHLAEDERKAARAPWRSRGAIHVNELPPDKR